ncbi:MAG: cytochrome c [Candidatus Marinimicrobia bacterium]|jgi:mono/diheme cytochrome c family protein|nr:cytochrome c [Candidatus Neomarinimicrobiota bacterium]MBT6871464.1 cytochrome c [Candidatus Neomarinimicrobiota bacterium]
MRISLSTMIVIFLVITLGRSQNQADTFFKQNCASCHTIGGGRLTGPDLKNIHLRKDDQWIKDFIADPQAVINSGDQYAKKIVDDSRGVIMPKVAGLTSFITQSIVNLIKEESSKERSKFSGNSIQDRPLTAADISLGELLFIGRKKFKNNGPACISCHHVNGLGYLGGGYLGPNLTTVYGELGGKNALAAWLSNPSSETMSPIYNNHPIDESEVLPLVAFFNNESRKNIQLNGNENDFLFMLYGIIGLVTFLIIFDLFWGNRINSIRERFIEGGNNG